MTKKQLDQFIENTKWDDDEDDFDRPGHCCCEYWRCQNYYAGLCDMCNGYDNYHTDN